MAGSPFNSGPMGRGRKDFRRQGCGSRPEPVEFRSAHAGYSIGMALPDPGHNSTALVTGASSGIGAEFARGLARRGHGVTIVARREQRLEGLASELSERHGVRAEVIAADLADERERDRLAEEIAQRGLVVDVLVNNAGFGIYLPFAASDLRRELQQVRLLVEAVVDLTGGTCRECWIVAA